MKVFAIEGAAYAGKTTILNYLHANFKELIETIPEASELVGGDKNFPDVPFKTLDDAKASTHFFIELEKNRSELAKKLWTQKPHPIILDRSTPISSLIFYSLLKHSDPNNSKLIDKFYKHAITAFNAVLKLGKICIPGNLIYIKPKNQKVFESRLSRGTKNEVFSSWDSFKFLDHKYRQLINSHFKYNHIVLETDNTEDNLKENAERIITFINESQELSLGNIFENFLNEGIYPDIKYNSDEEYQKYKQSIDRCKLLINMKQINELSQ